MSVGKPVVATNVGSIRRSRRPRATPAYLVPPGDAAALAERVVELLEDPLRAQAMGVAGRRGSSRAGRSTRWSAATSG